jgi:predicted phage-related endonuclease
MMRWGNLLEDIVAADFESRSGIELVRNRDRGRKDRQRTLRMKGHPLITCRLDRRTKRRPMKVIEVKTSPYGSGYGDAGEYADGQAGGPDGLPPRVRVQVYEQLAVTGYGEAIVPVLIGGYQRRDYVIPRDQGIIDDLVEELESWWAEFVATGVAPPMDGSDGADTYLRSRYPRETEDVLTATPEQAQLAVTYAGAKEQVKVWQAAVDLARQELADAIGSHAGMLFPGGRVTYKAHDVTLTAWESVANAYRVIVEELVGIVPELALFDLPPTVQTALGDLDAVASVHQSTRTDRPLRLTIEEEQTS